MKLTIHDACWDAQASEWSNRAIAAGVRWLKVVDDPSRAFGVAQAAPGCQVIYRKVAPPDIEALSDLRRHPEFSDALDCAEMFVRLADVRTAPNLWVEGANEVKLADLGDALWYGRVEALRSRMLESRGLRAVVGNFATGNPDGTLFRAWMQAYRDNLGDPKAIIGLHEYGTIALPAARDGHNLLRHRLLRAYAPGYRWAITECGLDQVQVGGQWVGGGWRAPGSGISEEAYWQFMREFNAELERDADVVCACVFSYGDTPRWKDYEMNDAQAFNSNLIAAVVADGQQATPTPEPSDWTHTVAATDGLNVRSSADNLGAANKIGAMVNGQRVRVVSRTGDWARIDYPLVGYCWAPNLKARTAPTPPLHKLGTRITLPTGARFVDVSAWQTPSEIDWRALAWNDCKAAMIRLAAGVQTDPEWHLYAAGAQAASVPWFGYVYYSFQTGWQSQIAALTTAVNRMSELPSVAIDLEGANPTKGDADLKQYLAALSLMGIPVALYTRQSWVTENLPQLATIMPDAPLIVANYRYPIGTQPALPPGYATSHAWQHVAGEKVVTDKLHWARFRTTTGAWLDESIVTTGLSVCAGKV
ncbi:hypothetical protein [Casimicrobium huifangae]|uniref:hypothetical protein n=1 Tax=Casimicrobium huifangae TaxID=2591109 RepID=UPI0037834F11